MQHSATNKNISSPKHILIVDDDGDVRDVVTAMLREHGYRVSAALGGASMRALLKGDDPVDAIVLDALMPGESGKDLALHAKELRLPVVMISGSPEPVEFAAENGLQLLPKPFRMQQLFEALDEAIGSGEFGQRGARAPTVLRGPSGRQANRSDRETT